MEKAVETDNQNSYDARTEYESYATKDASAATSGHTTNGADDGDYEPAVDNMRPLEITWHPDDLVAHEHACSHATKCMLKDETLFSDGSAIVRILDGHRVEYLTRGKLRYDILQHLDIRNRDGVRILTPVGIVHHVLAVLLARLPREHPPPPKVKDGTRRRSVNDDGCPASTRKLEDDPTQDEVTPCPIL